MQGLAKILFHTSCVTLVGGGSGICEHALTASSQAWRLKRLDFGLIRVVWVGTDSDTSKFSSKPSSPPSAMPRGLMRNASAASTIS